MVKDFTYFERLYPPELLGDVFIIDIPFYSVNQELIDTYINPLIKQGYNYHYYDVLSTIYLILPLTEVKK